MSERTLYLFVKNSIYEPLSNIKKENHDSKNELVLEQKIRKIIKEGSNIVMFGRDSFSNNGWLYNIAYRLNFHYYGVIDREDKFNILKKYKIKWIFAYGNVELMDKTLRENIKFIDKIILADTLSVYKIL